MVWAQRVCMKSPIFLLSLPVHATQRRGPQNRIPARLRCELLGLDFTMRGVAAYMRRVCERYARGEGPPLRVVVLAGAGIRSGGTSGEGMEASRRGKGWVPREPCHALTSVQTETPTGEYRVRQADGVGRWIWIEDRRSDANCPASARGAQYGRRHTRLPLAPVGHLHEPAHPRPRPGIQQRLYGRSSRPLRVRCARLLLSGRRGVLQAHPRTPLHQDPCRQGSARAPLFGPIHLPPPLCSSLCLPRTRVLAALLHAEHRRAREGRGGA